RSCGGRRAVIFDPHNYDTQTNAFWFTKKNSGDQKAHVTSGWRILQQELDHAQRLPTSRFCSQLSRMTEMCVSCIRTSVWFLECMSTCAFCVCVAFVADIVQAFWRPMLKLTP